LKIAPHNVPVSSTGIREYGLSRALRARLMGALLATTGVVLLVVTVVTAVAGVSGRVMAGLVLVALLGVVVTGVLLGRGWYVVRLDDTGYRVRFVRGVGRSAARWTDVEDVATAFVSGNPCVVLRLRNGGTSTLPVDVLEGDREELVDELPSRGDGLRVAGQRDLVAAHVHVDQRVLLLDDAQQAILRPQQLHHRDAVGVDGDGGA